MQDVSSGFSEAAASSFLFPSPLRLLSPFTYWNDLRSGEEQGEEGNSSPTVLHRKQPHNTKYLLVNSHHQPNPLVHDLLPVQNAGDQHQPGTASPAPAKTTGLPQPPQEFHCGNDPVSSLAVSTVQHPWQSSTSPNDPLELLATVTVSSVDFPLTAAVGGRQSHQGETLSTSERKFNEQPSYWRDVHFAGQSANFAVRCTPGRECAVCGETASGRYFGALVCLPCKSFFIRQSNIGGESTLLDDCGGSCNIQRSSRARCKYCRYQKCLSAGMSRKEKPEAVVPGKGQVLCKVCNDIANGIHFGVTTCEGCKKFFRRGLQEHHMYRCKRRQLCTINPRFRTNCRYCRFQRCLHVGMSRDAIKLGRRKKNDFAESLTVQYLDFQPNAANSGTRTPREEAGVEVGLARDTHDNEQFPSSPAMETEEGATTAAGCPATELVSIMEPTLRSPEVDVMPDIADCPKTNTTGTDLKLQLGSVFGVELETLSVSHTYNASSHVTSTDWSKGSPLRQASSSPKPTPPAMDSWFTQLEPGCVTDTSDQQPQAHATEVKSRALEDKSMSGTQIYPPTELLTPDPVKQFKNAALYSPGHEGTAKGNEDASAQDDLYDFLKALEAESSGNRSGEAGSSCHRQQLLDCNRKVQIQSQAQPADGASSVPALGQCLDLYRGLQSERQSQKICRRMSDACYKKPAKIHRQHSTGNVKEVTTEACWLHPFPLIHESSDLAAVGTQTPSSGLQGQHLMPWGFSTPTPSMASEESSNVAGHGNPFSQTDKEMKSASSQTPLFRLPHISNRDRFSSSTWKPLPNAEAVAGNRNSLSSTTAQTSQAVPVWGYHRLGLTSQLTPRPSTDTGKSVTIAKNLCKNSTESSLNTYHTFLTGAITQNAFSKKEEMGPNEINIGTFMENTRTIADNTEKGDRGVYSGFQSTSMDTSVSNVLQRSISDSYGPLRASDGHQHRRPVQYRRSSCSAISTMMSGIPKACTVTNEEERGPGPVTLEAKTAMHEPLSPFSGSQCSITVERQALQDVNRLFLSLDNSCENNGCYSNTHTPEDWCGVLSTPFPIVVAQEEARGLSSTLCREWQGTLWYHRYWHRLGSSVDTTGRKDRNPVLSADKSVYKERDPCMSGDHAAVTDRSPDTTAVIVSAFKQLCEGLADLHKTSCMDPKEVEESARDIHFLDKLRHQRSSTATVMQQFMLQTPGADALTLEDVGKLSCHHGFSAAVLQQSSQLFQAGSHHFRQLWDWAVPSTSLLSSFKARLLEAGVKIHQLQMDRTETAFLCGISLFSADVTGLRNEESIQFVQTTLLNSLEDYIASRDQWARIRVKRLFSVMPEVRFVAAWHSALLDPVQPWPAASSSRQPALPAV